jgi:hypothetical protein
LKELDDEFARKIQDHWPIGRVIWQHGGDIERVPSSPVWFR